MTREEFLAQRRTVIGGSDVAAILGESQFSCALGVWMDKRGVEVDEPRSKHLERGNKLEDFVASEWAAERGREISRWHFVTHPKHAWAGGNIDRRILKDKRGPGVLECKVPSKYVWLKYRKEGLPEQYILQGQWYLFCTGWKFGAYAIFNAELMEFADEGRAQFEFERDDKLIAAVLPKMEIFQRQVEYGPSPEKLDASDRRCQRCKYRPTCHDEATVTGLEQGETTFSDDPKLVQLIRQYSEFGQIEKAAAEEKDAAREELRSLVKPGKTKTPAGSVTLGDPVKRFSMDAVRKAEPELAKRLEEQYKTPGKEPFFGIYPAKEK